MANPHFSMNLLCKLWDESEICLLRNWKILKRYVKSLILKTFWKVIFVAFLLKKFGNSLWQHESWSLREKAVLKKKAFLTLFFVLTGFPSTSRIFRQNARSWSGSKSYSSWIATPSIFESSWRFNTFSSFDETISQFAHMIYRSTGQDFGSSSVIGAWSVTTSVIYFFIGCNKDDLFFWVHKFLNNE